MPNDFKRDEYPFGEQFDTDMVDYGRYPIRKHFYFDHASYNDGINVDTQLNLLPFRKGKYAGGVPVVTAPGSDMPGFILRPYNNPTQRQFQIVVYNRPVFVPPIQYRVYPLLAVYYDETFATAGLDVPEYDWSGQDGHLTPAYNWIRQKVVIGIGYGPQQFCPWHYNTLAERTYSDENPGMNTVHFPTIVLPYWTPRQENTEDRRRNIKLTQKRIGTLASLLMTDIIDEYNDIIDTRAIQLQVAQYQNQYIGDVHYIRHTLTTGVASGSSFYTKINWYTG